MIDTQTITWRDAKEAIDNLVSQSKELDPPYDKRDTAIAIHAVNSNLQFRDYFLGLPKDVPLGVMLNLVSYLGEEASTTETKIPFMTIASAYCHEAGQYDLASEGIDLVLSQKEYPLAMLLRRLYNSDTPSSTWGQMRNELHEQVIKVIQDNLDMDVAQQN